MPTKVATSDKKMPKLPGSVSRDWQKMLETLGWTVADLSREMGISLAAAYRLVRKTPTKMERLAMYAAWVERNGGALHVQLLPAPWE